MAELQGIYASFDNLTPAIAEALWRDGYRVFSQQLWTAAEQPANRVTNMRTALQRGFTLVGPIAINGSTPGDIHVNKAREGVPDDIWNALALVPIDVELEGIPNQQIRGAVERCVGLGKRRSLYYSVHTWIDNQGDPAGFRDCLTYVARYDGVASLAFVQQPPSMQGAFLVGKQYTNTLDSDGLETCREVWDAQLLIGTPPVAVDPIQAQLDFHSKVLVAHEGRIAALEARKPA